MPEAKTQFDKDQASVSPDELHTAPPGPPGACVVFVRRNAMLGIGHVGWGFLIHFGHDETSSMSGDANLWEIGAVENLPGTPITPPLADGYWHERTSEPLKQVAQRGYDHYKVFAVSATDLGAAFREEAVVRERPYVAAVSNCMNDVHAILRAYGAHDLPDPSKLENWVPNTWYDHIEAPEYAIDDPSGLERRDRR
jgi:hypothetical protein